MIPTKSLLPPGCGSTLLLLRLTTIINIVIGLDV
jgi:hypothetical protein